MNEDEVGRFITNRLNEMIKKEHLKIFISDLMRYRIPVPADAEEIASSTDDAGFVVAGVLGLLNGIICCGIDGRGIIVALVEESTGRVSEFMYAEPEERR